MRPRPNRQLRLELEPLEAKRLLNAGPLRAQGRPSPGAEVRNDKAIRADRQPAGPRYTLFRITNPTPTNAILKPPFQQVFVQKPQPVRGQVYNVLYVTVRNSTSRTFDANSGLFVRLSGQTGSFPVLTGDQTWKPNEVFVFYVLTKLYYPVNSVTSGGFQFNLAGSPGTAIPGPSGIFLRVPYTNPAKFAKTINAIVAFGPGARGRELGLPDTALWAFQSARKYVIPL